MNKSRKCDVETLKLKQSIIQEEQSKRKNQDEQKNRNIPQGDNGRTGSGLRWNTGGHRRSGNNPKMKVTQP